MPFSNCPFSFLDQFNQIKVLPFFKQIWTVRKFLPSQSELQKIAFAYQLVPRLATFCIWARFGLKNRVTSAYLLQCKTNFFIHLCF